MTLLDIGLINNMAAEDLQAFVDGAREVFLAQDLSVKDATNYVGVMQFGPSSIDLQLSGYLAVKDSEGINARHALVLDIIRLAGRGGAQFVPTHTVHVRDRNAATMGMPPVPADEAAK